MNKFPAMMFYVGDWLKDPAVTKCCPATRGIWLDALCAMHENGRSGTLTGTVEQLARVCRCSPTELTAAVVELERAGAADVPQYDSAVTLVNRRMKREAETREKTRKRVSRHRTQGDSDDDSTGCNAKVTRPLSVSVSISTSSKEKKPSVSLSEQALRLSGVLLHLILARKPDFKKPDLQAWAKDLDRAIRLDGRAPERIEAVIRWCQADPFWQANILSTAKLREKFDQLELKMEGKGPSGSVPAESLSHESTVEEARALLSKVRAR